MASDPAVNMPQQKALATCTPSRKGRLFRFSLRALLLLVLVSAIVCGWVANRMAFERREAAALKSFGPKAYVSWNNHKTTIGSKAFNTQPSGPEWLGKLLGQDFFADIESMSLLEVDDDDLKVLADLKHVPELFIPGRVNFGSCGSVPPATGPEITDAGLAYIGEVTGLRKLTIGSNNITNAGLKHLSGLSQLIGLTLACTRLTDDGLRHLDTLSQLRELTLSGAALTDAGLEHLGRLTRLEKLTIHLPWQAGGQSFEFSDEGLEHLKGLTRLKQFDVNLANITDAGLAHLAGLTQLEELTLCNDKRTDRGLTHLRPLVHLKRLLIGCPQVTDAAFVNFQPMSDLEQLMLGKMQITGPGLASLSGLVGLTKLFVQDTQITDAGVESIADLPQLEELNLDRNVGITDAALANLQKCSQLRTLNVTGSKINGSGLSCLKSMPKLAKLDIECAWLEEAALEPLQELRALRELHLHHCNYKRISSNAILKLKSALPQCEVRGF